MVKWCVYLKTDSKQMSLFKWLFYVPCDPSLMTLPQQIFSKIDQIKGISITSTSNKASNIPLILYVCHSVYINIVPHKALTSVLISKSLAELTAEGCLGPNKPTLIFT